MNDGVWPPPPAVEPPDFSPPVPWYQRWWIVFGCGLLIAEITSMSCIYHPISITLPQAVNTLLAPIPKSAFHIFNQCGLLIGVLGWTRIIVRTARKD